MALQVAEYPLTIRKHVMVWPSLFILERDGGKVGAAQANGYMALVRKTELELPEFVKRLDISHPSRFLLRGCYGWNVLEYRTIRKFLGVMIYFTDDMDAVAFRLAHYETSTMHECNSVVNLAA